MQAIPATNRPEPIGWHPPPDGHPTKRGVTRTELNTTTDEQLVAAMQRDPAALEEFYRRHLLALTRFATSRLSDPARVADVVAATFLTALESTDRYDRARGRPIAWLLGIATNLIAADRRARAREAEALRRAGGQRLLEPDDYTRLDEQIDAARRYQDLNPTLDRLSPAEREMLTLVGEHGLTPSEAAAALGIGAVAARMRLARARRRISRAASDLTASDLTARQASRQPSPSGAPRHGRRPLPQRMDYATDLTGFDRRLLDQLLAVAAEHRHARPQTATAPRRRRGTRRYRLAAVAALVIATVAGVQLTTVGPSQLRPGTGAPANAAETLSA